MMFYHFIYDHLGQEIFGDNMDLTNRLDPLPDTSTILLAKIFGPEVTEFDDCMPKLQILPMRICLKYRSLNRESPDLVKDVLKLAF
jgi:hypothetical protein